MYKEIAPLLENTVFRARIDENTGNVKSYRISPASGYKLHEISLDEPILDDITHKETGEVKIGYTSAFVTTGADYDFNKNLRQIYAEKEE